MNDVINKYKREALLNIEKDAIDRAHERLATLKKKRGGKFKITEKQLVEELANVWVAGEFSAAERILRIVEVDPELTTKDLIRGEIHLFIMEVFSLLKRRLELQMDLKLENLLWGKFSTEDLMRRRKEAASEDLN